jgi:hypothetical protein
MHKNEPSLLSHVTEVRRKLSSQEGGISVVIYCGRVHNENLMAEALAVHRKASDLESYHDLQSYVLSLDC